MEGDADRDGVSDGALETDTVAVTLRMSEAVDEETSDFVTL